MSLTRVQNSGPPEKNEYFTTSLLRDSDFELPPPSKEMKENDGERRKVVEVLYSDGIWYKGWLSSFQVGCPVL